LKAKAAAIATVLLLFLAISSPSFFSNMEFNLNCSLVGNINTILQYATSFSACGANVGVGLGLCSTKDANLTHKQRQI